LSGIVGETVLSIHANTPTPHVRVRGTTAASCFIIFYHSYLESVKKKLHEITLRFVVERSKMLAHKPLHLVIESKAQTGLVCS
jgi:hypothetical protein